MAELADDRTNVERLQTLLNRSFEFHKPDTSDWTIDKDSFDDELELWDDQRHRIHAELVKDLRGVVKMFGESISEDTRSRSELVKPIFVLVACWLAVIAVLLFFQLWVPNPLGDGVLIALVVNLSLAIVGLLGTVAAYYYTGKEMVKEMMSIYFTKVLDAQGRNVQINDD